MTWFFSQLQCYGNFYGRVFQFTHCTVQWHATFSKFGEITVFRSDAPSARANRFQNKDILINICLHIVYISFHPNRSQKFLKERWASFHTLTSTRSQASWNASSVMKLGKSLSSCRVIQHTYYVNGVPRALSRLLARMPHNVQTVANRSQVSNQSLIHMYWSKCDFSH